MSVEGYDALLADLKPRFIHHPESKRLIIEMLIDLGCDPDKVYFDVPRMRTSTAKGYLTTGIAYAFHPHRDTWYSAPFSQLIGGCRYTQSLRTMDLPSTRGTGTRP